MDELEVLYAALKRYSEATGRGAVVLTPRIHGEKYDAVYSRLPDDELVANMLDGELQRVRKAGRLTKIAHGSHAS